MKSSRLPAPPIALLKGISSLVPLPREANRLRIGFHPTAEAELDREPMRDAAFFMRSRGQSHSSDGDPREDAEPPGAMPGRSRILRPNPPRRHR